MTGPTYPAARAVSATVRGHFAACRAAAHQAGIASIAPEPDEGAIEEIVSAGFWASLRREEGQSPRISLAYLSPDQAPAPLRFARPLPLDPGLLARLAPAVERPGIHLGVWADGAELAVWGTTRSIPHSCFVLEVIEPGLLVIKRRRGPLGGKYVNVAVLHGDRARLVDEQAGETPEGLGIVASLLGFATSRAWTDPASVPARLAVSMRAHRRGGSLLIVPCGSDAWHGSVVHPLPYAAAPAYQGLSDLRLEPDADERRRREHDDAVRRAVDEVAGLTAVDGATVIDDRYRLLAFGVKIRRSRGGEPVQRVLRVEPVVGDVPERVDPSALGGTRHLSAAQFVHDQRDALALVASQDGRFTVFGWPPGEDVVHAHRIETLLL